MHVEMSIDSQAVEKTQSSNNSDQVGADAASISGSQVATAITREGGSTNYREPSKKQVYLICFAAVISIASLYLVFVLVL